MLKNVIIIIFTAILINIAFNYNKIIAATLNSDSKKSFLQLNSPDVWISSEAKGIEKYDIRKNVFEKYDVNRNDVLRIIKAENDYLFISKFGITKIDGKTKELSSITSDIFLKDKEIECVVDNEKGLYAGIKGIIGYYNYIEKKWQKWELPHDFKGLKIINIVPSENLLIIITDKNIIKFNPVEKDYRLISDNNEAIKEVVTSENTYKIYILTNKGIDSFDLKTFKSVKLNGLDNKKIRQIWLDESEPNNNLWLAGETFLLKYDLINKKTEDYTKECLISELAVKNNNLSIENMIRINDLETDRNIVWIATNGGGILAIDTKAVENRTRTWTENNGLPSNFVDSLEIDDNRIFACFNDGLAKLEKNKEKWDILRDPSEIEIFIKGKLKIDKLAAAEDYYGFLSSGVLFLYMRKEGKWIEIGKNIKDVAEDGNVLWMLSDDNKIIKHELENGKQKIIYPADKFRSKIVCSLISDKDHIYAGASDGVFSYNKKNKIWEKVFNAESKIITQLADDYVFIWIGTKYNGIIRYEKKSKNIANYGKAEGLLDNSISLIGIDNEYIWVIHKENSISRLSKMTNYWDTFEKANLSALTGRQKLKVKRFIPNELLYPKEKRWQIGKDWKVFKEIPGGLGGKWIEGELEANLNISQIVMDNKLQLTWFINNGELIKYNLQDNIFTKTMPADFVRNNIDTMLVNKDNSLRIVLK